MEIITRGKAIERGLIRYFTGKPCKRGHIAERFVTTCNCAECMREYQKKDSTKETALTWARRNKEKLNEKSAIYRENNPERVNAAVRKWRLSHRDKYVENSRKYYNENRDKIIEARRRDRRDNPDKYRKIAHIQRARKNNAKGTYTESDICKLKRKQNMKCVYCGKNLKDGYHVDHIIPLSKGGENTKHNLQLLCPTCNLRKGAKHPIEFAQSIGLLL